MPIYEYRCQGCGRRVSLLVRGPSASPSCPRCGSQGLSRLFSTFAVRRSEGSIYEDILSDTELVRGLEKNDPRALAQWSRRMGQGMDEQIGPEYEEMLDRMEAGEMPEDLMGEGQDGEEEE